MQRKILTNYNDGTFAWGWEGKYYKYFYNFELMIWLAVLFCTLLCAVQKKEMPFLGTVMLSIIGLTAFELLFEARARYLYTYIPMYIVLAAASFPEKE